MSTTNLLRGQSVESVAEAGYSPSVYTRKPPQQTEKRREQRVGLDNPGFEGDAVENSQTRYTSPRDVLTRSSSMPHIMATGGRQNPANTTEHSKEQVSKKRGLLRQRPKTTSGQDLRRKAFINSFKLRKARSGSYLVLPDEKYQHVLRDDRVAEFPEQFGNTREAEAPGSTDASAEERQTNLYEPVQTKNEVSQHSRGVSASSMEYNPKQSLQRQHKHARNKEERKVQNQPPGNDLLGNEYSPYARNISPVPEQKTQRHEPQRGRAPGTSRNEEVRREVKSLSESVGITEKDNSQLREFSRRLSAALQERAKLTEVIYSLSRNASPVGEEEGNFPNAQADRPFAAKEGVLEETETQDSRSSLIEELPTGAERQGRRLPPTPLRFSQEGQRPQGVARTEDRQKLMEEAEVKREKSSVARLADEVWRYHNPEETLNSPQKPLRSLSVEEGSIRSRETGDWNGASDLGLTAGRSDQSDVISARQRRAAFRKQPSFQDDADFSEASGEPGSGRGSSKSHSELGGEHKSTQVGKMRSATVNSEQDGTLSHIPTGDDYGDSSEPQRQRGARGLTPLNSRQQARYPKATADGHVSRSSPGFPDQRYRRGAKQELAGSVAEVKDKDDGERGNNPPRQILPRDLTEWISTPGKTRHLDANCVSETAGVSSLGGEGKTSGTGKHRPNNTAPVLPAYNLALMTKRPSGRHGYEGVELTDAFMATEDRKERRELQRQAAKEAAILRREASNLLWKAMDLERICDENARVRHVYLPQ